MVDQVTLATAAAAAAAAAAAPLPTDGAAQSRVTFQVSQSGDYTIVAIDLQTPAALASLAISVASSSGSVATFNAVGLQTVPLVAGTVYTVQPLATATFGSGGGSLSVTVTLQGTNSPSWQHAWVVSPGSATPPAGESLITDSFSVTDAGPYTLTLADLDFPAAVNTVDLIILNHGNGTPIAGTPIEVGAPVAASVALTLPAGSYDVFIVAQANGTTMAGLIGISVIGGSSGTSVAYNVTKPIGQLSAGTAITPAAAGTMSLRLNDVVFPAALTSLQAVVTQGASALAQIAGSTGSTPTQFMAGVGSVQLFVYAQPASGGQGAFAAYLTEGSDTLLDTAQPVLDSTHFGYAFTRSAPIAAASYQLNLNDYGQPEPFGGLRAAAVQQGALVSGSISTGVANQADFTAQAGNVTILVFPTLTHATDSALFGVVLSSAGVVALNATQGVGASYSSTPVNIPSSGIYVLQATDLGFPAKMSSFYVILTSGQAVVRQIYGGGQAAINVSTPGDYVISVLAIVGASVNYGQFSLNLALAPPPTVTLTAMPTSVVAGGTTTLTWSSTNATSCTGSDGWSGPLATSGSQQSSDLSSATTFMLACTGAGGTANATVQVAIAASVKGGGGAIDGKTLLALGLLVLWRSRWSLPKRRWP